MIVGSQYKKTCALINNPITWEKLLHTKPSEYWEKRGNLMICELFQNAAAAVPAYASLLKNRKCTAAEVKTINDLWRIPIISKESYLKKYPLKELCWDGNLAKQQMTISATSGSTGEPFYFPRTKEQDLQYAAIAEMYLRTNFEIHKKSTLYIVGWGMGVWIGGVFSYAAVRIVADRGTYPLSVITCGTSQQEILKALTKLGSNYDQVIIGGYPPMIKDLVDEGTRQHIPWHKYHIKFIFSAEGFSEVFRAYIAQRTGLKQPLLDTLNHYGTVDLGTMAHETALAILIRQLAMKNTKLNEALFGHAHRQPTLAQYIPELYYFEAHKGSILCSSYSGLPLVRYDLIDIGGVISMDDMIQTCMQHGVDVISELKQKHLYTTMWNLPFVYVFERRDFTVKLSGANIYPQEIRRALESGSLTKKVTGKCTISIELNGKMDQVLTVHIEMQPSVRANSTLATLVQTRIMQTLLAHNSEYAYLYAHLPVSRLTPHIVLCQHQDPEYFPALGKHRWVRKT